MIWLLCAANLIYLLSYAVRDVVALRVLTIVAAACLIPYFWLRPDPLMGPVCWNLVFIALNVWGIIRRSRLRRGQAERDGARTTLPRSTVIRLQDTRGWIRATLSSRWRWRQRPGTMSHADADGCVRSS